MSRPFFKKNNRIMWSEDYQPILKGGAGHDPTGVTYTTQSGVFVVDSNQFVWFNINIVTTAMTQGTLTDQVGISLPFLAASLPFTAHDVVVDVRTSSSAYGAGNVNANRGQILKGSQILLLEFDPGTAAIRNWTYGLTDLGVLTNTLNIKASGWYIPTGDAG